MLTGVHFLLSYACTFECDHCFLHCSPNAPGTFTSEQLAAAFDQIARIDSVDNVYFEGGEPFLFYPVLLEGIRMARALDLDVGIVTNAYWATSAADARLWLSPLVDLDIQDLSVSRDEFHGTGADVSCATNAITAARELGIPVGDICIESPAAADREGTGTVVGGKVLFKGRAAEKLTAGLPPRPLSGCISCPHEELARPGRVHIDAYGHVQLCQGISMGNMWKTPLSQLVRDYDATTHPICGPLLKGGPAELAAQYGLRTQACVDECHYCYLLRKELLDRFPEYLAPKQVYGITEERTASTG